MPEALLTVDALRAGYGDMIAVWDMSLQAKPGRVTALVGRNGAGKSTFLNAVAGLLPIRAGTIKLSGKDVTRLPAHQRASHGLALVPEGKRIFRAMTVRENLTIGQFSARHKGSEDQAIMAEMFDRFPALGDRPDALAGSLSGGQQQMLSIAQALSSRPSVLCLDEPSSGLAPVIVDEVFEIVRNLRAEGYAIVLVEQQVEAVLDGLADDIVIIDQGRQVLADEASNVTVDQIIQATLHGVNRRP
jgi:branched-chain amino acid transport system ATP-binding protein